MRGLFFFVLFAFPFGARAATGPVHLEGSSLPQEFKDLGMRSFHLYDLKAVAVFKDRIQFHRFPADVRLGATGLIDDNGPVSLFQFKPLKVMRFAVPFDVVARPYTLICTHPTRPRLSPHGTVDFCGITSLEGKVVFEFPQEQHMPDEMLQIIGMTDDGLYAEVYLGKLVIAPNNRQAEVGQPREILAWWYPDRLLTYPGPWSDGEPKDPKWAMESVFREFGARKNPPIDTTQ